jgi:ABC-type lipoprotein release transport system permease subunit
VAFAVFLVVASMCVQLGSYEVMEENATSLLTGHIQIQSAAYVHNDRLENTVPDATSLQRQVSEVDGVVAVAPRVETFALASAGERSFGALILGVAPAAEARVVRFQERVVAGRGIASGDEALLGEGLARNLGVGLGDEMLLLGSAKQGGIAALALTVVGLFRSGQSELDRSLVWAPLPVVQNAFGLGDEVHALVLRADRLSGVDTIVARLRAALPATLPDGTLLRVRPWQDLLPDVRQAIAVDRVSAAFFYWIIMILVTFSVVNTFIMTVFERTREFGVLLAIGMRPGRILAMLQWEAFFIWLVGAVLGMALAVLLMLWLMQVGIPMGGDLASLSERMYMPTRLYPAFTPEALLTAPVVMLLGTQLAALLPGLRLRRLVPAAALRTSA